jgi:TP901 family phage tail tape measure protein
MATVANLQIRFGADWSEAKKAFSDVQKALAPMAKGFEAVGKDLTRYVTAPILGLGGAALKFSTDLNRAMGNIASLGIAEGRVMELKAAIQDTALATGKATGDIADGAHQVISAFGDTADTVGILEINAKAAAAGLATTEDAIRLTSAVTKGYGDTSAAAVQKVSDLAFTAVRLGQTTFPELASAMGRVVSLSDRMGVSQEQLFGVRADSAWPSTVRSQPSFATTGARRAPIGTVHATDPSSSVSACSESPTGT